MDGRSRQQRRPQVVRQPAWLVSARIRQVRSSSRAGTDDDRLLQPLDRTIQVLVVDAVRGADADAFAGPDETISADGQRDPRPEVTDELAVALLQNLRALAVLLGPLADRSQHLEHERGRRGDLDGDRPDVDPVQGALQISVSGWKAAQANQKWSPWTTDSSWEPASGPEVA